MGDLVPRKRRRVADRSPEGLAVAGFAGLIVLGGALLALPAAHGGRLSFLDAMFTATSAVCVTGLVVVDTGRDYTTFGQIVILLLIQLGGIGVMSLGALVLQLVRRRLSLSAQAALSSSMLQRNVAGDLGAILRRVVGFVLASEATGAAVLFLAMLRSRGAAHAAYSAAFHAVSAFCNAGFSLYADSLVGWRDNPLVMITVMALIVLGGIGHPVAVDVGRAIAGRILRRPGPAPRLQLGSTVALITSTALVVVGAGLLLLCGLGPDEAGAGPLALDALFQSVTARTAGFNSVAIGSLPAASLLVIAFLMFVGGSPGSCAGGVKTTTFALWCGKLAGFLRGDKGTRLMGKYIPGETSRRASLLVGLAVAWNFVGLLVLLATLPHGAGLEEALVEQVSAFGTVGLSTGLTPRLGVAGKLWIMATMFVGRLGPLTLAVWAVPGRGASVRLPEGRIMVG